MDYAQARLQARQGERPNETLWLQLAATRELEPLVETAHGSHFRRWVAGIDGATTLHDIELKLRARLRDHISEVARWMPPPWAAATLWTRQLIDLPTFCYLARGEPPLAWMLRDPPVALIAATDDDTRVAKLRGGPLSFLVPIWDELSMLRRVSGDRARVSLALGAWQNAWHSLWPPQSEESAEALAQLEAEITAHLDLFLGTATDRATAVRRELARRLQWMFRRFTLLPAVAFVHLALAALDLERLRAELVRRAVRRVGGPGR